MDTPTSIELPDVSNNSINPMERELKDRFVDEYFEDFSYLDACFRIGYCEGTAQQYAISFEHDPYIQKRIAERKKTEDPIKAESDFRNKVINALFKEANERGAGSSHSARVNALSKLVSILGLEAPIKTKVTQDLLIKDIDFNMFKPHELSLLRNLLTSMASNDTPE